MSSKPAEDLVTGREPLVGVTSVAVVRPYVVRVGFDDGLSKEVDLEPLLDRPAFVALRDEDYFAKVRVDAVARTTVWPNGEDLAPEFLRGG